MPLDVVLGLGSNLGDRLMTLQRAASELASVGAIRGKSAVYESEPVGPPQPRFLNAAVRCASPLAPEELMAAILHIERHLGRARPDPIRWGPRTIDIDVLWSASGPIDTPQLSVPHPRLRERSFALVPLLEVAPEACDPAGVPYATLAAAREPLRRFAAL
jgi:2-amino-4-hydroxy-6-hydroxymethyldihydropteridine diphosphokinase